LLVLLKVYLIKRSYIEEAARERRYTSGLNKGVRIATIIREDNKVIKEVY